MKVRRVLLFDFLLIEKMDQRNCIKFCVVNEIKCARTFEMLTVAFGAYGKNIIQLWYHHFKEMEMISMTMVVLVDRSCQQWMFLDNRRLTIREIAGDVDISSHEHC